MRLFVPKRPWAHAALVAVAVLALTLTQVGAGTGKKKGKGTPPKVQETVGDLAFVVSRGETKVEGVGLVIGLDNTGVDPPPSWYRKQLVDEMTKAGVEKADKLLASAQVSMVIVRLTIPVGIGPKDRLDVQVEVPPACGTKSLAGGYLLLTRLREVMVAGGSPKTGPELALAQGPVMIGTPAKPHDPKIGRVLGGGRVKKEYPFTLVIKENRESVRTSKMLETVVNERFHQTEDGHQKGVATAKTPSYLELKVPTVYHQNQPHFFRVVQLLQMIDSPELRIRRIDAWSHDLLDPTTAGVAAMKLEGLGPGGIEPLQAGLKSANSQVKFFCAEALAYLNDIAGVEALGATVVNDKEFRTYALAALAALDQPAAHLKLRKLMDDPKIEVRYGAFNALRTMDPHDPFLGRVRVLDAPKEDDDADTSSDSMALAYTGASSRRAVQDDPFALYAVDSDGPPLVHVSRSNRSEIVIFGRQLKLLPPIVLDTGPILLNASQYDDKLEISKIVASTVSDGETKVSASLDIAEVVRRIANLGATYPEVVAMLDAADRQKNIPGKLVVDAAPTANTRYLEAVLGKDLAAKRDNAVKRTSAESSRFGFRGLFGIFNRRSESEASTSPSTIDSVPSSTGAGSKNGTVADANPGSPKNSGPGSSTGTVAKNGDAVSGSAAAKKDDAVQKATAEPPEAPRRRLFDFLRPRHDS
jgi:flagellar basal body P-ring protein FlgI